MSDFTFADLLNYDDLVISQQWKKVAELGEQFIRKDPMDRSGYRYSVMDAYAVMGDDKAAEDLAIRYCAFARKHLPLREYHTRTQILEAMDEKQKQSWMKSVDPSMAFQFAMALWKNDRKEEALKVLSSMSSDLNKYLDMDENQVRRKRAELRSKPVLSVDTIDLIAKDINIPYAQQLEFRNWIRSQDLRNEEEKTK